MQTLQQEPSGRSRIASIDILRGAVMIIMALDHVRDFLHITAMTADPLDPATTTPGLFFARWITHFCAPIFVFLSGLSAYISGKRKTRSALSIFLIKRALWLIVVEVVVITFGLTFNPGYNFIVLQVIWALACSMIILALLLRTSYIVILISGLILFFFHNITDFTTWPKTGPLGILLTGSFTPLPIGQTHMLGFFYAILPWTGIYLIGYSLGKLYESTFDPARRKRILFTAGISIIALFILIRFINYYGDPSLWKSQTSAWRTFLSFLNTSKYPPSFLYSCMTLGPALVILSLTEKISSRFSKVLAVYGSVPFFYYIPHFFIVHGITVIAFYATGHTNAQIADPRSIFFFRPPDLGFSLPIVLLIWLFVVASLYLPCKWYSKYKQTHTHWWLSYL
jgi:uncharacterized membrane protein